MTQQTAKAWDVAVAKVATVALVLPVLTLVVMGLVAVLALAVMALVPAAALLAAVWVLRGDRAAWGQLAAEVAGREEAPMAEVARPEPTVLVQTVAAPAVQRLVVQVAEPRVVLPEPLPLEAEPMVLAVQQMGSSRVERDVVREADPL